MPYIDPKERPSLDAVLAPLLSHIEARWLTTGQFNYVVTRIVLAMWKRKHSYDLGSGLIGGLHCVAAEFYRRHLGPYEDEKRAANGDVS